MDLLNFAGSGMGLSRDLNPEDTQFFQLVTQTDKPIGDDELNYFQHIAETNLKRFANGLCGDGIMGDESFAFSGEANLIYLNQSIWLVGGLPLVVANSAHSGTVGTATLNHAVQILLGSPPGGALTRTDEVFLETWFQEVASPGYTNADTVVPELGGVANNPAPNASQQVINTYLGRETSRKIQMRWRIRLVTNAVSPAGQTAWGGIDSNASGLTYALVPGSTTLYRAGHVDTSDPVRDKGTNVDGVTLDTVNGFSYAIHLASVLRRPGVTILGPGDILSGPPHCLLHIDVPRSSLVPPLPTPLPGEDAFPITFYYDGIVGDSSNGTGIAESSLASSSLASSFTVPPPAGGGTTFQLSRVELKLARRGTDGVGTDVLVSLVVDAAGPTGALVGTFLLPKEWLTDQARMVSVPFGVALTYGTTYWVVLTMAGDGTDYVAWIGQPTSDAARNRSMATTGPITAAWPTPAATLHLTAYSGTTGNIRNTIEGMSPDQEVTLMEYDDQGLTYTGDVTYLPSGAIESASLLAYSRDATSQSIVEIVEVNS
jgi:hypothetical protein